MVGRTSLATLVLLLLVRIDAVRVSNGDEQRAFQQAGSVGCRFSNLICNEEEECVDDGLFGNCQRVLLPKDMHRYRLRSDQLLEMEGILQFLIDSGFTWRHKFTQCILWNALIAYRNDLELDLKFCDPEGSGSTNQFPYLDRMYQPGMHGASRDYIPIGQGRDHEPFDNPELRVQQDDGNRIYSDQTYQKRWTPHDSNLYFTKNGGANANRQDMESLDEFFNDLSPDELRDLQRFLVEEENKNQHASSAAGHPVKKSPALMTSVSIKFNPKVTDNSAPAEKTGNGANLESDMKNNIETDQMMADGISNSDLQSSGNGQNQQKENYKEEDETVEPANPSPPVQHVIVSGPGSQLSMSTIIPSALGKDSSLIKLEPIEVPRMSSGSRTRQYLITMYFLCGVVGVIIAAALVVYVMRRHAHFRDKLAKLTGSKGVDETTSEYQDLCRQHMQTKLIEKTEPSHRSSRVDMITAAEQAGRTTSTGSSSTSSWTEEPIASSMDISTGHIILSYMEDHLTNKDRLQKEWDSLCAYDAEPCSIVAAIEPMNMRKNRYTDILPYEHSRVKLNPTCNVSGSDYINACTITDHDPRNPAYIAAQGPLPHTVADFWQMVWEQGSLVIVNLTRLNENTISVCHRYWPEEGSDLYHIYEVHLVSEHAWCDDYVVRSFFLKNLQTNETRTITQFHFLTWPNLGIPSSTKTLLDFRRKVNKSYRGRSCPIIVHCSDGAGRTGTYCLIDMALNRLHKGAKEIDIAATLEHIRDQRINMVRTKEQFEFALAAVAEEVHATVNAPQQTQ